MVQARKPETFWADTSARQDWLRAEQLLQSGEPFEATVVDENRGGVVVRFGHLRGFVPNSHLTSLPWGLSRERRRKIKSDLIGRPLFLRVIEIDRRRRQLILTERDLDPHRRKQLWEEVRPGETRTGVVRSIQDYGAFIDLGGIDGLLHISELDWKHTAHPSDLLEVGQEIEVYVLKVDKRRERIRLSRKRLVPDPWPIVASHMRKDQIFQGTVSRATQSGLLVDLGQGVEGLIRFSELTDSARSRADLVPGSTVWVRVRNVDHKRRRISLSLAKSQPGPHPTTIRSLWQKVIDLVAG
jgi:small subunit ribosomal protein S1